MNVRLTQFQREEIRYKIDVMREGFDDNGDVQKGYMAHHYGFAREEDLEAMYAKLSVKINAPSLIVDLEPREAHAAWGELENCYDIASENAGYFEGHPEARGYASDARRYKDGMERIAKAFPNEEFK